MGLLYLYLYAYRNAQVSRLLLENMNQFQKLLKNVAKAPQNQVYWVELHVNVCGSNL
jgi:hypothetical protein